MKRLILASFLFCFSFSSVYFSPAGGSREQIIRSIQSSKENIDCAIYSFTSKEIALALMQAKQEGRKVRLIVDKGQLSAKSSVVSWLSDSIETRVLPTAQTRGIMHHKFMLLGSKTLITGSYNWTDNAEFFNYENLLIFNDKELIPRFQAEFNKMWQKAKPIL